MSAAPPLLANKSKALPAIGWGGLIAGILDITTAFIRWRPPVRLLQGIASGLLGPRAFQGGWGTAVLGLALHFFIAFSAAAIYYAASRKLAFLRQRAVVWGLFYGIHVHDLGGRASIGSSQEPGTVLRHWPRPQPADPHVLRRAAYRVSSPAIFLGSQGRPFSSWPLLLPPFQGWIIPLSLPTACALGCNLSPLYGWLSQATSDLGRQTRGGKAASCDARRPSRHQVP